MVAHKHFALPLLSVRRFLFDESCADYKYYEYRLADEEKALKQTWEFESSHNGWY